MLAGERPPPDARGAAAQEVLECRMNPFKLVLSAIYRCGPPRRRSHDGDGAAPRAQSLQEAFAVENAFRFADILLALNLQVWDSEALFSGKIVKESATTTAAGLPPRTVSG